METSSRLAATHPDRARFRRCDAGSVRPGDQLLVVRSGQPLGARQRLGIGVVNGVLYAIGGEDVNGVFLTRVEAYDPNAGPLVTSNLTDHVVNEMPARRWFGVGVVNGILYAVGGEGNSGPPASVEAFDPNAGPLDANGHPLGAWTVKAALPSPRGLVTAAVVDGVLYAIGGNNNGYFNTVFAYDAAMDKWTTRAPMPTVRAELAAGVIDGRLYAIGGLVAPSFPNQVTNKVESFIDLVWSSTNSSVATVSQNGQAHALHAGSTDVKARIGNIICEATGQCATLNVSDVVSNTVPTVTIYGSPLNAPAVIINVGQNLSMSSSNSGSFFDADSAQTWSAKVSYGDNSGLQDPILTIGAGSQGPRGTFALNHTYTGAGQYTVTVTVTDSAQAFGNATLHVTVNSSGNNSGRIFLGLPGDPQHPDNPMPVQINSAQWGCGSFLDTNATGGHWSATVNYNSGDPASQAENLPLTIAPPPGSPCVSSSGTPPTGVFFFNHAYDSPGTFSVGVVLTNTVTGKSASGGFKVQIHDRPIVSVPGPITAEATSAAGAAVPFTVTATDFAHDALVAQCFIITGFVNGQPQVGASVSSGAIFPLGTTTVGCVATVDGHTEGNFFTVTVMDTKPPTISASNIKASNASAEGDYSGRGLRA